MNVYRIALNEYCDLSGEGAKRYGGRWNHVGIPAIYAGESISVSLLERLTIDSELFTSERYKLYSVMEIHLPEKLIYHVNRKDLPENWHQIPAPKSTKDLGSLLLNSPKLCFSTPSILDPSSLNFVINPLSKDFHLIESKTYPLSLAQGYYVFED
ncbi:RES family NAD+ phosphorylase [Algoriphagus marincola]|uniref:RES family NAD+ phosphorylase n=1 Tax=Algoriphagus marincola TaxID=264027 RepID=A0ABS7N0Q8_9BACT|nr:RES family NAD+ phosphorylase [Algoriphagus marincola]MBY5949581.1 RES family NAD+ phosphorylase [Algoriphagus marincola]